MVGFDLAAAETITFPKVIDSFVASTSAIAKSTTEQISLDRSQERLEAIRRAIAQKLITVASGATFNLADAAGLEERALLCDARKTHIEKIAGHNYLNALVSRIEEVSKREPATDIFSGVKLLLVKVSVDVSADALSPSAIKQLQDESTTRCHRDIKSFDEAYFGIKIQGPVPAGPTAAPEAAEAALPSLSFLGPVGVVIDTFLGIFSPLVAQGANLIDEKKRVDAVVAFLHDAQNQKRIKNVGEKLATDLSAFALEKRRRLAASFVEQDFGIRRRSIDLSKLDECKDLAETRFKRADSGSPDFHFMLCWKAVWGQYEKPVAELLKVADSYDSLADAGDTDNALKPFKQITADLTAIKEGAVTNRELLWGQVLKLVTFANTVVTAFSKENREKMGKAIDDLVKS